MDCTQALDDDFTTNLCTSDDERRQVGWLEVGDTRHEVFNGENRIGRDSSLCQIVIDSKTLSKEHAVIEVSGDGTPFMYDLGSLNKTRLGKTVLQPEARYQLLDGSEVLFADIKAVYKTISDHLLKDDDSGSETGSESMLNISAAEDTVIPATPAPVRLKPSIIEETIIDNDVEDKQKPTFKSPETASTTEVPGCSTGKEQSDEETDDIYEAETQADEFYADEITSAEINDDNKDGLNITDDIFAAETQCDDYMSAEEQGNKGKDESINRSSRKSNTSNTDQEKSICEAENQSLDHISPSQSSLKQSNVNKLNISPSQSSLKQSNVNKLNREGVNVSKNMFEDNKSLLTSSEKVTMNSKTSCRGKVTFSENNNLEKNNNINKVGASQHSSEVPADNINPVLDATNDDDVDDSIYEADTLCMESEFQFLTPKRPLAKKDVIEESENEEDITEMATQYLDLQTPSPNHPKSAETKDSKQDITEMPTQQIDIEQATSTKQVKSSETKDSEQDISEMATLVLDLEPASTKQPKSIESEDAEQDITEMATLALDLEPASTKQPKSIESEDAEEDITEMATQQLDLEPASSNQHKSAEREAQDLNIGDMATQELKIASTNELKSAETKSSKQNINNLATQQLDLEPASVNQVKSAETLSSKQKSLCAEVYKNESEKSMNKADEKQKNSFSENKETLQPSNEDPSSPSLLQEDNEDLNGQEQRCSDEFNKIDKQLKDLNESSGKDTVEFQKNNAVASDLAVNKETYKTAQDNVATDSGDETDSENIFEAQTQLFCENSTTNTDSERCKDMHGKGLGKKKNDNIDETTETKSTEIVRHPQEDEDDDTKSEDLYETHLQTKTEEDRSSSYSSMINNVEVSEKNTTDLPHSGLKKSKECKENDSAENDDIYEADTQIIDFDGHSETNANINHTRKGGFENKMNVIKKLGKQSMQSDPNECANRNITTDSKNSLKLINIGADLTKDSKECTASVQNKKEIAAQKFPKVSNRCETVLTKSKSAKKEKLSTNLEEQDIENIFEAATQVIQDGKSSSPQPCTSKPLNLEEKRALGSKTAKHNNETKDCGFPELETHPIENEADHTFGKLTKGKHEWCNTDHLSKKKKVLTGAEVELKSKQDCSSHKASENSDQANLSTESDDSLMDAPTQILNEDTYNKRNITLDQPADTSCSKNNDEKEFETKRHHKSHTPRKNHISADNKPTTSMLSMEESERIENEMQNQISPTRNFPADEEVAVSPTLPSRISKHAPVGKRRGNRNISSEIEKIVTVDDVAKKRNKKAVGVSNQNQSVKDGECYDSSTSSILESSVEVKQSSSKENQGRKNRSNQGNKAKDNTSRNISVHSKNKRRDTSESPVENTSQNRPSRQRKMTWKVRESLLSDQETSDSDKSSRKRTTAVLDNSDAETSTPIKARKESSTKTENSTTKTNSASEHFSDISHSRTTRRRGKPDEQSSSYQKNEMKENASPADLNTSRTSNRANKRKAPDLEHPSSFKHFREEQKSFTEREKPTEDSNATLLGKKGKNAESKTDTRTGRTTRSKRETATEVTVTTTKSETRQASIDKSKSKNLKKQSNVSSVKELEESKSEPELEAQASSSANSKSRKGNPKTSLRLTEHNNKTIKERKSDLQNQEKNKLSSVAESSSKSDLSQTRSKRTAKEVENNKRSNNSRQKKTDMEERLDPGGSSKETENNTKVVETQKKERSSSRRKRNISNADAVTLENEEYLETPSKRSRSNSKKASDKLTEPLDVTQTASPSTSESNSKKASGKQMKQSDITQTSTPSTNKSNSKKASGKQMETSDISQTSTPSMSKSSTPRSTPRRLNKKEGKNSITTPQKKEDQSHSRNDINIDSKDNSTIITPKRASRKGDSQNSSLSETMASTPQRSTPRRAARTQENECCVLFTGISDAKQEAIVKSLGGTVVDLPESCTVLVTDKVRRTFKFLCIMGKGKPIVSPMWLMQSKQARKFLDPWKYLIKDEESEAKFHFSLKNSLETASKTNLLAGYNIFVTPKVLPPPPEMRGIVESCGGTYIPHWPSSNWPEKSFIISCKEDKAQWTKLKKAGKPIVGAEILLLGILQQKLDIKSNTLV